ncbi:MAG: NUDIX hydrolase [Muribaculaceae bacterium]|nr:NUDIX hydrolase [Muribaculaceae bacterium]
MSYTYKYPHAALTADCVIYGFDGERLKILLVERGLEPYKGMWALPGGFMKMDETIEETARRELFEETGLKDVYMTQFKMFSSVDRDPRERVVTVVFMALVRPEDYQLVAGDDASNALWFDERYLPPLAFDHEEIIREAHVYLEEMLRLKPIAFELLNKTFSLGELQKVYEVINRTTYDRRNFQRKVMQSGLLSRVDTPVSSCNFSCSSGDNFESDAELSETKASLSRRPGRKPSRLFTFRKKEIIDNDSESEQSAIRDIFDY